MISGFLSGIIEFIGGLGSIYFAPIDAIITNYLPSVADFLNVITNVLNMVTGVIAWFINLIPPVTRGVILFIISFWVTIWPLRIAVWNISFGLNFIKRINIFSSK